MKKLFASALVGLVSALMVLASMSASAQDQGGGQGGQGGQGGRGGRGPGGPGGGPGGGRGTFDRTAFMNRMLDENQKTLKMSDDEWKVVRPLVQEVYTKRDESRTSMYGGMRQRGGSTGQTDSPREIQALKDVLERESASANDIKPRLDALREYRAKKEAELKEAREKLRAVLTAKQEAQLVLAGLLD